MKSAYPIKATRRLLTWWAIPLTLFPVLVMGCAQASGTAQAPLDQQPVVWYEERQEKKAWPASDELAIFTQNETASCANPSTLTALLDPKVVIKEKTPNRLIVQLPLSAIDERGRLMDALSAQDCVSSVGLVYYTDKERRPATRLIHRDELIVRFDTSMRQAQIAALETRFNLKLKQKLRYAPNTMIYTISNVQMVVDTANRLSHRDGVIYAYPNWLRQRVTKSKVKGPKR